MAVNRRGIQLAIASHDPVQISAGNRQAKNCGSSQLFFRKPIWRLQCQQCCSSKVALVVEESQSSPSFNVSKLCAELWSRNGYHNESNKIGALINEVPISPPMAKFQQGLDHNQSRVHLTSRKCILGQWSALGNEQRNLQGNRQHLIQFWQFHLLIAQASAQ